MAGMKRTLLMLCCAAPLCCQPVSFGIKGGIPVTDALANFDSFPTIATHRWTLGPTVEINLPANLSAGLDALYRSYGFSYDRFFVVQSTANSETGHWEFPLYLKYRFGDHLVRPFVEAGAVFAHEHEKGSWNCSGSDGLCGPPTSGTFDFSRWGAGVLLGGGVEIKAPVLTVSPEFRYTRWQNNIFYSSYLGSSPRYSKPNQAELLVGIRF
jgi:hypothetical protein